MSNRIHSHKFDQLILTVLSYVEAPQKVKEAMTWANGTLISTDTYIKFKLFLGRGEYMLIYLKFIHSIHYAHAAAMNLDWRYQIHESSARALFLYSEHLTPARESSAGCMRIWFIHLIFG